MLQDYPGALSAVALKDNFDVIYQAGLYQLNSGPTHSAPDNCSKRPWIFDRVPEHDFTQPTPDIVLPLSLFQKLPTVTGAAGLANPERVNITPLASPDPWRKAGLRYSNSGIHFDVAEELETVVGPYVHPIIPITQRRLTIS
jgi:AP-3 complex subunit mu